MLLVLIFAITLLVAVLISDLAHRSVISTAVLFLITGIVVAVLGVVHIRTDQPVVAELAELALVSVLFTDGLRIGVRDLATAWHLPGRALLLGLPLTLIGTALLARWISHLSWLEALLVGAILSPTDPVFAAAIVGAEHVPGRLRHLLNVESGLNDGLALPIVLVLLGALGAGAPHVHLLFGQIALGIAAGIAIPWIAVLLERLPFLSASPLYEPLFGFTVALLVLATCALARLNEFLGTFVAGITLASIHPAMRDQFQSFGELVTELFKLAAILIFGGLISLPFMYRIGWGGLLFAALVILLVRPAALGISLLGSRLDWRERVTAAWFGPKGFASVVFGLLVLKSSIAHRDELFHLIAAVVAGSIVVHSTTDYVVAQWFRREEAAQAHPA